MKNIALLAIALVFFSCQPKPYVESYIEANAVWSEDYQTIAIIRSSYKTQNPEKLFYADETAQEWKNIVFLTDAALQNRQKIYEWNDERENSAQGWLQTTPVYYNNEKKALYYPFTTYGIIRKLETGKIYFISVPKETIRTIFVYNNVPVYEADGLAPVIEVLPSYAGTYVAVVHQVYIHISLLTGAYISVIGIFTHNGEYIGFINLTEYNNKDIYLKNNYYPTLSGYDTVPTHTDTLTVWENDTILYVLNKNYTSNNLQAGYKITINSMAPRLSIELLDDLSSISLLRATAGGPISDGNPKQFLIVIKNLQVPNLKGIAIKTQN